MIIQPFHLAVPVHDLKIAEKFYFETLGLKKGRSSNHWVDFDFYGHQFVIHEVKGYEPKNYFNSVDHNDVPVPHFGVVLKWNQFWELSDLVKQKHIKLQIEPYIRFEGKTGEQATMFFYDPSGNALEFKAFKNPEELFKP